MLSSRVQSHDPVYSNCTYISKVIITESLDSDSSLSVCVRGRAEVTVPSPMKPKLREAIYPKSLNKSENNLNKGPGKIPDVPFSALSKKPDCVLPV